MIYPKINLPSLLALSFLFVFQIFYACSVFAENTVDNASTPSDASHFIFPYKLDYLHHLIAMQFDSEERSYYEDYNPKIYQLKTTIKQLSAKEYADFMEFPLVLPHKFYVFYGAYPHIQHRLQTITPLSVADTENPALQHYATLPLPLRTHDFYLWSPDTPFWYSEIAKEGVSLPFRSYFIVHLEAIDEQHTRVEVIEDEPVASFGRKLGVDSNRNITHFDIRPVAPTQREPAFLLGCIKQFVERDYPGRKYFSCH